MYIEREREREQTANTCMYHDLRVLVVTTIVESAPA